MPDLPYFPIYPGDYMADTRDLSATEHGAYLLLLMASWSNDDCTIPNDPKRLRRMAAVETDDWGDVWSRISRFFTVDGDRLYQKRLRAEHRRATTRRENGRAAGLRSAQARQPKSNQPPNQPTNQNASTPPTEQQAQQQASDDPDGAHKGNAPKKDQKDDGETLRFLPNFNQAATNHPTKIQPTAQPNPDIPDPEPDPEPESDLKKGSLGASPLVALQPRDTTEPGWQIFSLDDCRTAMAAYNAMADRTGNPKALALNDERIRKLKSRLKECGGLEGWQTAIKKVEQSKFLTGRTNKNFRCGFDFMLQKSSFLKIIEGFYDSMDEPRQRTPMSNADNVDDTLSSLRRISDE